jgi:hypothetical protein
VVKLTSLGEELARSFESVLVRLSHVKEKS